MNNTVKIKHNVFAQHGASNHSDTEREENDFYATHPDAVLDLLSLEKFNSCIWEPCCGQGHISKVLESSGYKVMSTDLINRGYGIPGIDILGVSKPVHDIDIITNPPYKIADEVVSKCLSLLDNGRKCAMLLKLLFLESQRRKPLFEKYPPKYVYVFSKRTNCAKDGDFDKYRTSAVAYAWFVWEKGSVEETILRWI